MPIPTTQTTQTTNQPRPMAPVAPKLVAKNGRSQWLVDLRRFGGGRKFFNTEEPARRCLAGALRDHARFGKLALELPIEDRQRYLAAEARLAELGTTLNQVIEFWERSHRASSRKDLADAIAECLAAKATAGKRGRYLQQLRYSLESVLASVGNGSVCDIELGQIERWLSNEKWSLRTRKGKLTDLRTFFSFARKRGWAPSDPSVAIERIIFDEGVPGILSVPQVQKLFEVTRELEPTLLPFITLGTFAGVRPAEIRQLTWSEVNLQTGYCEIPAHVAKRVKGGGSRQRRLIKLQPNAIAWLRLGGDLPPVNWWDKWERVRRAAGFELRLKTGATKAEQGGSWSHNAMRHSFCSYCLPIFGELKESEWAGHSPQIAISRYRELVTEEEARKFWSILPTPTPPAP